MTTENELPLSVNLGSLYKTCWKYSDRNDN